MQPENVMIAAEIHRIGIEELRARWPWLLGIGILLAVLGTIAIGAAPWMTLATMYFLGWLMILGGVFQTIHAFTCKGWRGFFLDLLTGLIYAVVGFMIVANPLETALILTLLIAILLIFGGIFRIVLSLSIRFPNWGWLLAHGIISVILGIAIWRQWPSDALWVIGLFVGIDMIFNGWELILLGLAVKRLPPPTAPELAANL